MSGLFVFLSENKKTGKKMCPTDQKRGYRTAFAFECFPTTLA
jgi:hypothetical protein